MSVLDALLDARLEETFTSSLHPRGAAGSSAGGKFVASGSSGSTVSNVQKKVGAKQTGSFDYGTRASVIAYQKKHGLVADGVVGRQTATALRGEYTKARRTTVGALSAGDLKSLGGNLKGAHGSLKAARKAHRRPTASSAPTSSLGGFAV